MSLHLALSALMFHPSSLLFPDLAMVGKGNWRNGGFLYHDYKCSLRSNWNENCDQWTKTCRGATLTLQKSDATLTLCVDGVGQCTRGDQLCRLVYAVRASEDEHNGAGWYVMAYNATGKVVERAQPANSETVRNDKAYCTLFTMNLKTRTLSDGYVFAA